MKTGLMVALLITGCASTSDSKRPRVEAKLREYSFDHVPNVTKYTEEIRDSPSFEPQVLIGGLESVGERLQALNNITPCPVRGRVSVNFVVDEEGSVIDPQTALGIHEVCDAIAVEAVRPAKFIPAKIDGQPIRLQVSLPMTFN